MNSDSLRTCSIHAVILYWHVLVHLQKVLELSLWHSHSTRIPQLSVFSGFKVQRLLAGIDLGHRPVDVHGKTSCGGLVNYPLMSRKRNRRLQAQAAKTLPRCENRRCPGRIPMGTRWYILGPSGSQGLLNMVYVLLLKTHTAGCLVSQQNNCGLPGKT